MHTYSAQNTQVALHGIVDAIRIDYRQKALVKGGKYIHADIVWKMKPDQNFIGFVSDNLDNYIFCSADTFINTNPDGHIYGMLQKSNHAVNLEIEGDEEWVNGLVKQIDQKYSRYNTGASVDWYYQQGTGISYTTLKVSALSGRNSFYPWLKKPLDQYINDYINSSASVLILLGPPGTGKSSFIKHMLESTSSSAVVAYDNNVMTNDGLFINFLSGMYRFMIMEDADTFMASREDGNQIMHKFLNLSDGVISTNNKKLIFTTNLPSLNSVDDALLRPGRCFDALEFRPLTRIEACAVCEDLGRPVPDFDGSGITLANLLNKSNNHVAKQGIGFI